MILNIVPFAPPLKVCSNLSDIKVHIAVLVVGGVIAIGHTRDELEESLGVVGGYPIAQTDGPIELQWTGDIWINNTSNTANLTVSFSTEAAGNIAIGQKKLVGSTVSGTSSAADSGTASGAHYGRAFIGYKR